MAGILGGIGGNSMQSMMAQANAYGMAAQQAGAMNALPPKDGPMVRHAGVLHQLSGDIQLLNQRLCTAIDRITGPCPEAATQGGEQPAPQGALLVAQFGAERIQLSVGRLSELVNRLEAIVS